MTKLDDKEFEVKTITKVEPSGDGFTITTQDGWSFYSSSKDIVPQVGSKATFYGRGVGFGVRGLDIDGQEVFYRTPDEDKAKHDADLLARDNEKQAKLDAEVCERDARWLKLPIEFQNRLKRFASNNPRFRRDFEPYELMVCEQAVAMSERFPSRSELDVFHKAKWDKQKEMFPELDGGHSGNSFGCAVFLAAMYLESPKMVEKAHGAMCPLTGCKDYGCYAAYPDKEVAKV